ncbi:MAG: LPXTG cell wall anchor domain-containing protein, partial [Ilumatobacter sp.]
DEPVVEDEPAVSRVVSIGELPDVAEAEVAAPALMAEELGSATTISAQPYRRLPATGTSMNLAIIAIAMILLGSTASLTARRRAA